MAVHQCCLVRTVTKPDRHELMPFISLFDRSDFECIPGGLLTLRDRKTTRGNRVNLALASGVASPVCHAGALLPDSREPALLRYDGLSGLNTNRLHEEFVKL